MRVVRCWQKLSREVVDARCSRPGWMGPWAAWSSIRYRGWWPCLQQGGWSFMILKAPSNPSHSMILCSNSVYCRDAYMVMIKDPAPVVITAFLL